MKRILATAAIVAMSATAFAGGELDLRAGYKGQSQNTVTSSNQTGNGGVAFDRARLGFTAKTNDAVSGKAQLDLTTAHTGAATIIKYAEVTHKWTDMFSLTLGRLDDTGMSGFEGMRSLGDMYFSSSAFMKNYYGGGRLSFKISDSNELKVYLFNENFNASNTGTALGYGLQYVGSAGDLGYVVSYHIAPMTITNQPTAATNYLNLGVNYKMGDWLMSLDYDMNTYGKQGVVSSNDATKNSIVAMVDYNMGNWVPQLKFESSTMTDVSTTAQGANNETANTGLCSNTAACSVTVSQYSLGTEYKPAPADKFRYHLEYVGSTVSGSGTGATATNKTITSTTVYAGFRWQADFLK